MTRRRICYISGTRADFGLMQATLQAIHDDPRLELGIIATGDASIDAAKKAGGITNVASVDHDSTSILGLFATFCTVVKGN